MSSRRHCTSGTRKRGSALVLIQLSIYARPHSRHECSGSAARSAVSREGNYEGKATRKFLVLGPIVLGQTGMRETPSRISCRKFVVTQDDVASLTRTTSGVPYEMNRKMKVSLRKARRKERKTIYPKCQPGLPIPLFKRPLRLYKRLPSLLRKGSERR